MPLAMRAPLRVLVVGCCLTGTIADRIEGKASAARRASRFQEADVAMSRLQLGEEDSSAAAACVQRKVLGQETELLRLSLMQRVATEHGVDAATKLDAAFGGKGGSDKKCPDEKKAEEEAVSMTAEKRTELMMKMKPKELVRYWLPQDCNRIQDEEKADEALDKIEKDYNTGKPPEMEISGTTQDEIAEEKALKEHCDRIFHFLARAAVQFQKVKADIKNDSDQQPPKKGGDAEASTTAKPDTTATAETTQQGTKALLQLHMESKGLTETFNAAMASVLGAATKHINHDTVAVETDAHGNVQRERRSKQVARHSE